ncbi:hypothetical protein Tco_1075913, partial [Tanacetum coccineum]
KVVVVVVVCLPRPWMPNEDIGGGRVRLDVGSEEKRGGGRKIKETFKERKDEPGGLQPPALPEQEYFLRCEDLPQPIGAIRGTLSQSTGALE